MISTIRFCSFALLCAVLLQFSAFTAHGKSRDPIIVGMSDEPSQQIMAHIVSRVLKRAGFNSEIVELAGTNADVIASGSAHFNPSFVVADDAAALKLAIEDNRVISLGGLEANDQSEPRLKIIWAGLRKKWPYAEKMLKTMTVPHKDLEELAQSVDAENMTVEQVAAGWMKINQSKWKRWLSASTNWMKP